MADLPYTPYPTVDPSTSVPDDYQHIQASPNAFGASVGKAMQGFGQALGQAGDTALKVQTHYDDVAADNALNQLQDQSRKALYGETNGMPAADGSMPSPGFLSMQGADAMRARPEVEKGIDDSITQIGGGLNPNARQKFTIAAQRYKESTFSKIGEHTNTQALNWYTEVNKSTENNALQGIANNADDPTEIAHYTKDLIDARVKTLQLRGGGNNPDLLNDAINTGKQAALKAQVESIGVHDPSRAMTILDKNKDLAGTTYDNLATTLRSRAYQQNGDAAADAALAQAAATHGMMVAPTPGAAPIPTQGTTPDAVSSAIISQESGGNANAPTSRAGAVGPGQVMPATFSRYAKPGEDINNPTDNMAVSRRITDDYMQKYNGDPQRVAVAYFSGEGNVAPEGSTTPWLHDSADANGKKVSDYVSDVSQKVGDARIADPIGRVAQNKSDAIRAVLDNPNLNPEERAHALSRVESVTRAQTIAAEQTIAAKRELKNDAYTEFMREMLKPGFLDPNLGERIRADPRLDGEAIQSLTDTLVAHSGSDIDKATRDYGPGYWKVLGQVTAPPGTEGRITDINHILNHVGPTSDPADRLTLTGADNLREKMAALQKPETGAITRTEAGMLTYAKHQLSFEEDNGMFKIRDPNGEDTFNAQFIPGFYKAMDDWTKAGKSPYEFLSRDNMDKLIAPMRRTKEQWMHDRQAADLQVPEEDKKGQFKEGQIIRQGTNTFKVVNGVVTYQPSTPTPTPPTE